MNATPNKLLDASGGSVFRNWLSAAQGALIRAAASTQPLGATRIGRSKVMIRIRIAALLAITLLLFTLPYGQGLSQEATAAKAISNIRQVDFKNFTYIRPECEKETDGVQLRNGRRVSADGAQSSLMRLTYGDITGDGSEEAIVLRLQFSNSIFSST